MKNTFFIVLILVCNIGFGKQTSGYCAHSKPGLSDTSALIYDSIMNLNLASYIGKPVDSLLHVLPSTDSTMEIVAEDNPNIARKLYVTYQNWYRVIIIVDTFQYMNPIDTVIPRHWNITLFRKETIAWIFVQRGNSCTYGCNTNSYRE